MKNKIKQKPILKINGLMDNDKIRWKKIKCVCSQDPNNVIHQYPIQDCIHCKCEEAEKSIPLECWSVKDEKNDTILIKEITIVRGSKYHDVIGWKF
jgi:hypothetical protein